jgi:NAD(P)-dependent dehydrogenase (short-subunit alcohol dehydrogenase family)
MPPAAEVAASICADGHDAWATTVDVTLDDGLNSLVQATVAHYGRVDAIVANAGVSICLILDMTAAGVGSRLRREYARCVSGCFQAVGKWWRKGPVR